jgi:hypothetical protein
MDPISALSVAASVVQFVSFTSDAVKSIYEASRATSGQLPQHSRMKQETQKLLELNHNIQQILHPDTLGRARTDVEETLNDVCADCHAKATALMTELASLGVEPPPLKTNQKHGRGKGQPGQGKTRVHWRHVEQVIKSVWHQHDIEELQARFRESKEMLMMTIMVSLRYCHPAVISIRYLIHCLESKHQLPVNLCQLLPKRLIKIPFLRPNGPTCPTQFDECTSMFCVPLEAEKTLVT